MAFIAFAIAGAVIFVPERQNVGEALVVGAFAGLIVGAYWKAILAIAVIVLGVRLYLAN